MGTIDASQAGRVRAQPHDPLPPAARQLRHSVLLVVIDDVGTEWFDWHGVGAQFTTDARFAYAPTPFLSQMASTDGIWFSKASAESVCSPTRVAIHSGQLPHRTGVGFNMRDPSTPLGTDYPVFGYAPPDSITYLAERIGQQRPEVARGAFGKWHMADGWSSAVPGTPPISPPDVNLHHWARLGFETWSGNISNVGGSYSWWNVVDGRVQPLVTGTTDERCYPTAVHAEHAARWLRNRTQPFFAYVAFGPPHAPFTIPPYSMLSPATAHALAQRGLPAGFVYPSPTSYATPDFAPLGFGAMTEATDTAIRRVWEAVPAALRAGTFLIVIGDNGTVANATPPGFLHSKRQLFWGGTRVPLLVRGPWVQSPGRACPQIVHAVDLYRTICEILGVPLSAAANLDSVSMVPVLRDQVARTDVNALRESVVVQSFRPLGADPAHWNAARRQRAVFDGQWRLLDVAGAESLYDEATDPLEANDVAAANPGEVGRLRALMDAVVPD